MRSGPVPSSVVHCMNGDPLAALLRLNMVDDPRVQAALAWQERALQIFSDKAIASSAAPA